jgi:predicted porin
MKTAHLAGACLSLFTASAVAQSSVTLWGLTDASIRYLTNSNRSGDSVVQMGTGGLSESRLGLTGREQLGGGTDAIFEMVNRLYTSTGQADSSLPFWNVAFVGLQSSTLGRLTLGRQTNTIVDTVTQAYGSNPWVPYDYLFQPEITLMNGIWTSNLVKYVLRAGDVFGELSYSVGGVPGHTAYGSQKAVGVAYLPAGPVKLGAAYSDSQDPTNGAHSKAWTLGGSYTWNSTRVHFGYFEDRLDAAFKSFPNASFSQQALVALKYLDFSSRRMFSTGLTQTIGTALHMSANYWRTLQTGKSSMQDGSASQFQIVMDYDLSKRTDVYVESDYGLYRKDLIGAQVQGVNSLGTAQKGTQLELMVGMRHRF